MKYIEKIPVQLQIMYNCDYLVYNSDVGLYSIMQDGLYAPIYCDCATRDEIQSALADIEEANLREAEYWANMREDVMWQKHNC